MTKGVLYGFTSYLIWGFFPLYFKALEEVPALQIVFHRVVWSFLFLIGVIFWKRQGNTLREVTSNRRTFAIYSIAAVMLAINWLLYVWAVNNDHIVESSLGYFIKPLVYVALGVVLLRERLRPVQWVPVGLAAVGVLYLTLQFGSLPWIALGLAFSFGFYGLMKKIAPLGSLNGLAIETGILFLPALSYLVLVESQGSGTFGHTGWSAVMLLVVSGVVTPTPLLLFASAARIIPLSLLGILQYVAPTCQFLLGVLLYREPFTRVQLVGFSFVWLALVIFTVEGFVVHRRAMAAKPI